MMYLETVKATTRYWGIHDDEAGAYALQCCSAAAAEQEAQGQGWTTAEVVAIFSEVRRLPYSDVVDELAALCQRHKLPPLDLVVRFLAVEAARLEAEAADFRWGTEDKPVPPELAICQLLAAGKKCRGAKE